MGAPIVRNVLAGGHCVTVSSRSRPPVDAAVAIGATAADGPTGVARGADVIVLALPTSSDVEAVVSDLLPALRDGAVVVDCSTIDPEVAKVQHERVHQAGGRFLEAPMSGGTVGAEKGTLTLMVGGRADVIDRVRPVLDCFASLVVHMGGPGSGQLAKLCNNLIYAAQMVATAEATAMAVKGGLDLVALHQVLTHATGDCVAVRTRMPVPGVLPDSPETNDWRPGFTTALMAKDVDLALGVAARLGVTTPSGEVSREVLAAALAAGYAGEDFSAVGKVIRDLVRA